MSRPAEKASYIDLFDRMKNPLLIISPEGGLLDINPGAETFFKLDLNNLASFDLSIFFSSPEEMKQELRRTLRKYQPRVIEKTITLENQTKHLLMELCCLDLTDGEKVIQLVIKDQTELVEAKTLLEQEKQKLQEANELLAKISITDKLTNLFNRRHFDESLTKEFERATRTGSNLSLIIFDVDKFKHYNDTNGHGPGDELLTELAVVIKKSVRNIDIPCRYGGEEFVVLCPETNSSQALVVAERIRLAVQNHDFKHKEKQPLGFISVSVGISTFPENSTTQKELKENSDHALYQSKNDGRNRTTIFQSPLISPLENVEITKKT